MGNIVNFFFIVTSLLRHHAAWQQPIQVDVSKLSDYLEKFMDNTLGVDDFQVGWGSTNTGVVQKLLSGWR